MTISAIENVAADFMRPGHRVIWRCADQVGMDHNGKYFCHPHKIFDDQSSAQVPKLAGLSQACSRWIYLDR